LNTEPVFLVIDVGTGGLKCLAFDVRGRVVFSGNSPINFSFNGPAIEFDANSVWRDICLLTRSAAKHCSGKGLEIVSVSATSMREGNVFYDKTGRELLAVPNLDYRASEESSKIQAEFADRIYSLSGHWPSPIFLLSRLSWLKIHDPKLFSNIHRVSMINDWVLFKFSGNLNSEPTNGCETALFDLAKRRWSEELIKESGFDNHFFPEVRECGTLIGTVSSEASLVSGLETSVSVVIGAADTEAAVAGCGLFESGKVVAVAGTTTPVQAVTDSVVLDSIRRTWSCCHVLPNRWVVESNAGATGLVFKWWAGIVGQDFSMLDSEVNANNLSPNTGTKVSIGTTVMNAKNPHPISGRIEGVGPWTPRAAITLGILQTNCFSVSANLTQIEQVVGKRFEQLYFCGGSSKSSLWTGMQADVLGRPLVVFEEGEATARGASMLSAVAISKFRNLDEAAKSFLSRQRVVEPQPGASKKYAEAYEEWLRENKNN